MSDSVRGSENQAKNTKPKIKNKKKQKTMVTMGNGFDV
jgi:hypothetical protein